MSASVMLHGARLGAAMLSLLVAFGPALGHAEPAAGPRAAQRVYEVKIGDTLTSLAKKYGVTVATIVKSNKLPSADAPLKVGQHLVIPVSDTAVVTARRGNAPSGTPTRTAAPPGAGPPPRFAISVPTKPRALNIG